MKRGAVKLQIRKWHWRLARLIGLGSLGTFIVIVGVMGALTGWLAASYSQAHPLDLGPYIPRIEGYLAKQGLRVSIGQLQLFYDDSPVVRMADVGVFGANGEMGVFVEQAAIKLSLRRLLVMQPSPKVIEAKGVTLRVVRRANGVGIAGLDLGEAEEKKEGAIAWLNGLRLSAAWGRLKDVKIDRVNLLLRDEVQDAEWALENGRLAFARYTDDGEHGTLTARVRRLYGEGGVLNLGEDVMPVLVSFDHEAGKDEANLSAKFDQTDVGLVSDYLPPQLKDLLKARGSVELGITLHEENVLSRPWVTLRLANAVILPPKGFSAPLEFPKLTMTAAYMPSPTDVLEIKDLAFVGKRGNVWRMMGKVEDVTTDPLVALSINSEEGDIQGIFDLFPDQPRGFNKALKFLRPNIKNAEYENLKAIVAVRPSVFPHCEDACGTIEIATHVKKGEVKFMPEFSPIITTSASFVWSGQSFSVTSPKGKLADQEVSDVVVTLTSLFSPSPTHVLVSGTMVGGLNGVLAQLRGLDDEGRIPPRATGTHVSRVNVDVPMPRGREATFSESTVTVKSDVRDFSVEGVKELGGEVFSAKKAEVELFADKSLRIESEGVLGSNPLKVSWQQGIDPLHKREMFLNVDGRVSGQWLMDRADNLEGVMISGPVTVAANLVKTVSSTWRFGVKADAGDAVVKVDKVAFDKPKGESLEVTTQGVMTADGALRLDELVANGKNVELKGKVAYDKKAPDATMAVLKPFKLGRTDVNVNYVNRKAEVVGTRLDISGLDVFGGDDGKDDGVKNLALGLKVDELLTENGKLRDVSAQLNARDGKWDIERFVSVLPSGAKVNVRLVPLQGQGERRKLTLNVDNLGETLTTLGLYDKLSGGKMWGEITYDTPTVGGGVLKVERFELRNPPVLMKLLSLISLQQLVAGTDGTIFDHATLPVRIDGDTVRLDKASLEGPSMSIRLDGTYQRGSEILDFDGRLAPAIPFNRLVSKIPLVGTILTGSQDGVVVADFKLKGPAKDPAINVRPLSVLTPGLVKDFWRGLTGGN